MLVLEILQGVGGGAETLRAGCFLLGGGRVEIILGQGKFGGLDALGGGWRPFRGGWKIIRGGLGGAGDPSGRGGRAWGAGLEDHPTGAGCYTLA